MDGHGAAPRPPEPYTFTTRSDDGVRLWVDGALVIDAWATHAARDDSATVALTAGRRPAIRLEHHEGVRDAVARLSSRSARQAEQVVPVGAPRPGNAGP